MKTILVTGGAGFIGSNFIEYFLQKYDYKIINLDALTYAGNLENLKGFQDDKNHTFIKGDICDFALLEQIFANEKITDIIHFAAHSHVDNSITSPDEFMQTNIIGTHNLLKIAYKFWLKEPFCYKENYKNSCFLHISTDEVFGSLKEIEKPFTENSPYRPNSPYSASKASSDMLVRSYNKTYGLNTFITNCSNNFGKKQHDEKLIPTIIKNAIMKKPIPIYGNGQNLRDWLYVKDHIEAIDAVFHSKNFGEFYNIGGNNEIRNLDLAYKICDILNTLAPSNTDYKSLIKFVKDRHGHDFRYSIDATKIKNSLQYKTKANFDEALKDTIKWYVQKYDFGI